MVIVGLYAAIAREKRREADWNELSLTEQKKYIYILLYMYYHPRIIILI